MKTKVYKIAAFILVITTSLGKMASAQEVPVPHPALPAAPAMPEAPNVKFDEKKWEEFGKKFEKAFEGFDEKMKTFELGMVDFNQKFKEKFKDFEIKFKDMNENFKVEVNIPELPPLPPLPEIPALPELPPMPEVSFNFNTYQVGAPENAIEKIKKLSKSYPASASDVLVIDHTYGRINVNTWDKNEVKVDVEIKAYAEDEDDAQKLLDGVTISNSKTGNQIAFKTNIENNNKSNNWMSMSYWNGGSSKKQKVDVFYTVYMPAKTALNLKTNYTNVVLPNLDGAVTVNMNYGDISTGDLSGKTNVKTNYTQVNLGKIEDAVLSANYGSLKLVEADNVNASLNYCSINLGKLNESAVLKTNYSGGLKIGSLAKDFKSLNISSNYSTISLGFEGSESFNFDVSTSYAGFNYNDLKTKITSKTPSDESKGWTSTKQYKGVYGKGSSEASVTIKANYGSVKFN